MNFKELQPYRVWYQYLQTCLNDKVLNKKIDKEYYNKIINSYFVSKNQLRQNFHEKLTSDLKKLIL